MQGSRGVKQEEDEEDEEEARQNRRAVEQRRGGDRGKISSRKAKEGKAIEGSGVQLNPESEGREGGAVGLHG
eukprot:755851-Hanusia_phi.AAC.2